MTKEAIIERLRGLEQGAVRAARLEEALRRVGLVTADPSIEGPWARLVAIRDIAAEALGAGQTPAELRRQGRL